MRGNNNFFPSLNIINGKTSTNISKGIIRHDHNQSDTKLGLGNIAIIKIPCSFHAWRAILSLS